MKSGTFCKIKKIFILILSFISISFCVKDKCRVLVLQGGGDKGAYQAGVIKGLVDNLTIEDISWDIITGVSVGSINALILSLYPIGEEKEAANWIVEMWKNIKGPGDFYQNWPWGIIEGFYFKSGLYDISPLRSFLETLRHNRLPKRKFVIGATDYESGNYVTWNEINLLPEELIEAVISSSSIYGFFPINQFKNSTFIDGGLKMTADIPSGVNRCIDMGHSEENIIVDVIYCSVSKNSHHSSEDVNSVDALSRVLGIIYHDRSMFDLDIIQQIFPKIKFRYVIAPSKLFPSDGIPIKFSPKEMELMINYGIQDSIDIIEMGWRVNLENLLRKYKEEKISLLGRKNK